MSESAGGVRSEWTDDVLVLTLDHPPSNALTWAMRQELLAAVSNPGAARAIILRGAGTSFSSGISLDPDTGAPSLAELCLMIAQSPVPVVAALAGRVIGPGAELAIAARMRLADDSVRIAFPDVGVGQVPAAGASQRLPRLIGPDRTLQLLVTGRAVPAQEALAIGLVDAIVSDDLTAAAISAACALPDRRNPDRGLGDARSYQAVIVAARETHRFGLPALHRIIDCVEAAQVLPLENGLALEAVAREDLEASDEAGGLRAAAAAERRAAAVPNLSVAADGPPLHRLGFCGVAPGMAALALFATSRGFSVTWTARDREALAHAQVQIAERQEANLRAGRLTPAQRDLDRANLKIADTVSGLRGTQLLILAAAKEALPVHDDVGAVPRLVLGGASDALGLALAPSGRMSELSVPPSTFGPYAALVADALRRMGLPPVLVGPVPGLGQRLNAAGETAVARIAAGGVPLRRIGAVLEAFGARMPEPGGQHGPVAFREMPEAEILERWLGALANEGLRLLEDGLALRSSDLDHILVSGYGFPRWRGGPMYHADRRGLLVLRHDLRDWAEEDTFWTPAPLIDRLISRGHRLSDLDQV